MEKLPKPSEQSTTSEAETQPVAQSPPSRCFVEYDNGQDFWDANGKIREVETIELEV